MVVARQESPFIVYDDDIIGHIMESPRQISSVSWDYDDDLPRVFMIYGLKYDCKDG